MGDTVLSASTLQGGDLPTDRGKPASKYHVVVNRNGLPRAVRLSAANAHDTTQLLPLIDAIPPIIGPRRRPCRCRRDIDSGTIAHERRAGARRTTVSAIDDPAWIARRPPRREVLQRALRSCRRAACRPRARMGVGL